MGAPGRTARPRARRTAGLSVVEVTLLVSVVAIVLAASAPAFVRALRVSKLAEAPHQLAQDARQEEPRRLSQVLLPAAAADGEKRAPSLPVRL